MAYFSIEAPGYELIENGAAGGKYSNLEIVALKRAIGSHGSLSWETPVGTEGNPLRSGAYRLWE